MVCDGAIVVPVVLRCPVGGGLRGPRRQGARGVRLRSGGWRALRLTPSSRNPAKTSVGVPLTPMDNATVANATQLPGGSSRAAITVGGLAADYHRLEVATLV